MYAGLEVGVGVLGMGLVWFLPNLGPWLAPLFGPLLEIDALIQPLRFAFAFVLLLGPAAAMGATLPLLVRALSQRPEDFGTTLGTLYGWNTLGAVFGALVGELVLIEPLGVMKTAAVAGGMNLLAAVGAFAIARSNASAKGAVSASLVAPAVSDASRTPMPTHARRVLAAAFVSGGLLLALQVIWFRLLLLFVPGTGRAFAVMLGVVLSGIALGSLVASIWQRRDPDAARYSWAVALLAGSVGLAGYGQLDLALGDPNLPRVVILSAPGFSLATMLMFPTSFFSGVLFTLFGKALNDSLLVPVRSAGLLTLANTLGAAIGPIVAGFLLLPRIGVEASLFWLCAAYLAVALLGADYVVLRRVRAAAWVGIFFVSMLVVFPFGRLDAKYVPFVLGSSLTGQVEVVAHREGLTETIHVTRVGFLGEPAYHMLVTDGYPMSTSATMARRYMNLFVHIPVALHPGIESALLISYGVGNTAKSLTQIDGVRSIDVVDISRDILDMSTVFFPDEAENPLRDSRVDVHIEDGRYFLQTTRQTFDLITAEPPPPNIGNVTYLYTQEYFQLAHDRLNPGGMLSYWLPVEQLQMEEAASITGAFCAVFDDCTLWNGGNLNWILLGSRGGLEPVSEEAFTRQWRVESNLGELRSIGIESPEALGAVFIADATQLEPIRALAPPVRDSYPLRIHNWLEPTGVRGFAQLQEVAAARKRFAQSTWARRIWPRELHRSTLGHFRFTGMIEQAMGHLATQDLGIRLSLLRELLETTDLQTAPLLVYYGDPAVVKIAEAKRGAVPKTGQHEFVLAQGALVRRDFVGAADHFESAASLDTDGEQLLHLAIYGRCRAGDRTRVDELRAQVFANETPPTSVTDLGRTFARDVRQHPGIDGCWAAAWQVDWQRR